MEKSLSKQYGPNGPLDGTFIYRISDSGFLTERTSLRGGPRPGAGRPRKYTDGEKKKFQDIRIDPTTYAVFNKHKKDLGFKNADTFIKHLLNTAGLTHYSDLLPTSSHSPTNGATIADVTCTVKAPIQQEPTDLSQQKYCGSLSTQAMPANENLSRIKEEPRSDSDEHDVRRDRDEHDVSRDRDEHDVSREDEDRGCLDRQTLLFSGDSVDDVAVEPIPNVSQVKFLNPNLKFKRMRWEHFHNQEEANSAGGGVDSVNKADSDAHTGIQRNRIETELFNMVPFEETEPGEITPQMKEATLLGQGRDKALNDLQGLSKVSLLNLIASRNNGGERASSDRRAMPPVPRGYVDPNDESVRSLLRENDESVRSLLREKYGPTLKSRELKWITSSALQGLPVKPVRRRVRETKFIEYHPDSKRKKRAVGGFVSNERVEGAITDGFESFVLNEKMGSKMFRFKISKSTGGGSQSRPTRPKLSSTLGASQRIHDSSSPSRDGTMQIPPPNGGPAHPPGAPPVEGNNTMFLRSKKVITSEPAKMRMEQMPRDAIENKNVDWAVRRQAMGDGNTMKYFEMAHNCAICAKKFLSRKALLNHMKLHSFGGKYVCHLGCEFVCENEIELEMHLSRKHAQKAGFCETCDATFVNVEVHMRETHGAETVQCTDCDVVYGDRESLERHKQRAHMESAAQLYSCPSDGCQMRFPSRAAWKLHHTRDHLNWRPFKCDHVACGKVFSTAGHLRTHGRTHGNKPYSCDVCKTAFRTSWQRLVHQRRHAVTSLLTCSVCGFSCRQKSSLDWHMSKKHSNVGVNVTTPTSS